MRSSNLVSDGGSCTSQVLQGAVELRGCLYRGGPDLESLCIVQAACLEDVFCILDMVSTRALVCLSNSEFGVEVVAKFVVASSQSKYIALILSAEVVDSIFWIWT